MTIDLIEKKYNEFQGMKKALLKSIDEDKDSIEGNKNKLQLLEQAQAFLQKIAQETQNHLKFQIEDIVNLALDTCFPNEYEFKLEFEVMRGKTEARLVFLSQRTQREVDPMNASGGGVVDLTSFALRIASYVIEQGTDNVIIFDEPFRFVSRDLQERAGLILKKLSEKLNIQIILVTHIPELVDVADRIIEVKKTDGISKIKYLKK